MKRKVLMLLTAGAILVGACSKSILDIDNPNEPGLPALESEEGIKRAALGIYDKFGLEYWWLALQCHDIMGDTYFTSVGNFAWRWVNQPTSITLGNGTVVTPPQGGSQATELKSRNSRDFGNDNVFYNEWLAMYLVNNQANLLLDVVDRETLTLSGDDAGKRAVIRAWAYWWKGFAYSRIGSLYISGVISNVLNETNDNFVTYQDIIAEANRNFDEAIGQLNGISMSEEEYRVFFSALIPSFTAVGNGGVITPDAWIRNINTYKARNLLVNKFVDEMTSADWEQVKTLAQNGIRQGDKIFTMRSALQNDLVGGDGQAAWQTWRSTNTGWSYISERLIQEFKPGDARFTRNFTTSSSGFPFVNRSGRGLAYGTRYDFIWIEDGGDYSTQTAGLAEIPIAASFEENHLMLAEAFIKTGDIETGLGYIDDVREAQRADLPAVAGTGLDEAQAYEELRRERRIALINKNVSFYDARRWGVLKPVSQGGGRTGAVVLYTEGEGDNARLVVDDNATIDYNYLERWDVPANELDFNAPREGSAPVVFQQ